MRQYYRVFCLIEGKEENIRTTYAPRLRELEIKLDAKLEPIPQCEVHKINASIQHDTKEFSKPSTDIFFNHKEQFINMEKFRKELDVVISKTSYHQQTKLFDHSKELNKYIREKSPLNF